ncbi:MAG: GNAT family N-acetyltransferase, partial [Chloroflexi bacterium]|nr:GNAT family N-acetyltransferase [Chloroflexota bacterium]
MWITRELTDKSEILAYLETDRPYAAYAIGDLETGLFEQCTWAGAERDGRLQALALYFRGLRLPAFVLMGEPEGLQAIFRELLYPQHSYLTCCAEHLAMLARFYAWEEQIPMWRMALEPLDFRPVTGNCVRLGPRHADQLTALYAHGGGDAFMPSQLERGVFYGIFAEDKLVAAAGTHLVSPTYHVAAVGNVFTHPDYRGRGFGTVTTSAVIAELLQQDIADIVL